MAMDQFEHLLEKIESMHADVREVKTIVTGGSDPQKGLTLRVDRLEQSRVTTSKALWIAVTAGVGTAIHAAWQFVENVAHRAQQ